MIMNTVTKEIQEGYISRFNYTNGSDNRKELPSSIIHQFYTHKINTFSGNITAFDITNKFLWEMGYKDGLHTYKKKILNANKNQQRKTATVRSNSTSDAAISNSYSCTAFFLVTYWSNGTIDYQYLGMSCTNNCEQTISINNRSENTIRSNCDGSGGNIVYGGSPAISDVVSKLKDPCLQKNFKPNTQWIYF